MFAACTGMSPPLYVHAFDYSGRMIMDAGLQPESEAGGARRPGYWRTCRSTIWWTGASPHPGGRAGGRAGAWRACGALHGQLGKLGLREIHEQGRREGARRRVFRDFTRSSTPAGLVQ